MNTNGRKEHPILFSGPMVRAILEGRKTQTRRVITFLPEYRNAQYVRIKSDVRISKLDPVLSITHSDAYAACPYGKAGDRLWVRETFSAFAPSGQSGNWKTRENVTYVYKADLEDDVSWMNIARWYPSIFLPRIASRITLEITDVRVERLKEISGGDAQAEGVEPFMGKDATAYRARFQMGWDDLNEKRGHPWESNPWVWVLSFKRIN